MSIEFVQYLDENGNLLSGCGHKIDDEALVRGYQSMLVNRAVDERMVAMQRQGEISFSLNALGDECSSVAAAAALDKNDWIYPQYREAGAMFWRGCSIQDYAHHMFGNKKDPNLGRLTPDQFGSRGLNIVPVISPFGCQIPHAAGCAYAMKLQQEKQVVLCFFGEGADCQGDFHAGLNFSSERKVPAIFFCRNNGFAVSTAADERFSADGAAARGRVYNMRELRVDGSDFFAVHEAVSKAREHCLGGKGPVLIEAITYRTGPHSISDDSGRRLSDQDMEKWGTKDSISRLRKYLEGRSLWNAEQEEQWKQRTAQEINTAVDEAKKTEKPPLRSLFEHVYFEMPETLKNQYSELQKFFPEKDG